MHAPSTSYCVVLVDDHRSSREELKALLQADDAFRVCGEAGDPEQTLALLEKQLPDLLLLDFSLDRGDGLSLTHQVRAHYPDLPILILSAHQEELYAERALRAGANGYVMKADLEQNLTHAMRQVLCGKVYVSATVHNQILNKLRSTAVKSSGEEVRLLSDRELEIFNLLGQDFSPQQIADRLGLSVKTVETHRSHIKKKIGCRNNALLGQRARRWVRSDGLATLST